MIVLDAGVLIAYLDGKDVHHDDAQDFLEATLDDELGINSLNLAEVLVQPARQARLQEVRAALAEIDVRELPFPLDTAVRLAMLRTQTGLKMPDCCVLLAAETHGAAVASFDDRVINAAERHNLSVHRRGS